MFEDICLVEGFFVGCFGIRIKWVDYGVFVMCEGMFVFVVFLCEFFGMIFVGFDWVFFRMFFYMG